MTIPTFNTFVQTSNQIFYTFQSKNKFKSYSCRRPRCIQQQLLFSSSMRIQTVCTINHSSSDEINQYQKLLETKSYPENVVLRDITYDHFILHQSHNIKDVQQILHNIRILRRQRLSLLLADLCARIRCEHNKNINQPSLSILLSDMDRLAAKLLNDTTSETEHNLRASIRECLWKLRQVLEPLNPSSFLRNSFEVARSGLLDIPDRIESSDTLNQDEQDLFRREMFMLTAENILLEELRSLRVLERQLNHIVTKYYPNIAIDQLEVVSIASASLGLDDYRVRGKTRLADAIISVRNVIQKSHTLIDEVDSIINILYNALVKSLETDLSTRQPAGEAMLLRPRMDDIPNFGMVDQYLLRGGQPTSRGLEWLRNYGVAVVVDLRGSDRKNQWHIPKCHALSLDDHSNNTNANHEQLMRFCNIPIEDYSTPTVEQVDEFVNLVNSMRARGNVVFVHCKAGIGRTGTLIACWRIANGATAEYALSKESLYCEGGGGLRQEKFVRDYAAIRQSHSSM